MTTTSQSELNNANTFTTTPAGGAGGTPAGSATNNNLSATSASLSSMQNVSGKNKLSTASPSHNGNSATNVTGIDTNKRKKLKSRNFTLPHANYTKDHLDAWLEACLKDASNAQLSSSSEFLDYNPSRKSPPTLQQQQHQQQPSHSQHGNMTPTSQQFALRTNNNQQASSFGVPPPFSQGFQRSMPNFMKPSRYSLMFPMSGSYLQQHDPGAQDFASLPPIVNLMGGAGGGGGGSVNGGTNSGMDAMGVRGSSELENNSTDVLDSNASNANMSRGFRFSDPCLLNPSDNDSKVSGQNTPDRRTNLNADGMDNQKFFAALMEQINILHETNSKICRNLHETKVDIEALKHAPTWGMRHRRDSLSGLSTHSQPMVFGGGFGTQSPAPTYHSGAYTPGMMTDVVREVKEAARVREDALLNRVKAMVEERQWTMSEANLRMLRDIEELKAQIHHLRVDRKETNKRINHLEAENKYMRQMIATLFNNRNVSDIIYENEALRTRKSTGHGGQARRSHSLNLNYGTVHHQPVDDHDEAVHLSESTSIASTADIGTVTGTRRPSLSEARNSFSSCDEVATPRQSIVNGSTSKENHKVQGPIMSPPTFALVSPLVEPKSENFETAAKSKKEAPNGSESSKELQRELQEAVVARREADQRIIALEKVVNNLRLNSRSVPTSNSHTAAFITKGDGLVCSGGGDAGKTVKHQLAQRNSTVISTSSKSSNIVPSSSSSVPSSLHQTHMWHINPKPSSTPTHLEHPQMQQDQQRSSINAMPKLSVSGPITDL